MSISFNEVPSSLRLPFLYAEFDNQNAVSGPQNQPYKTLMFGPMLPGGTKDELTLNLVTSYEQAKEYFGAGSLVADMAKHYLEENSVQELYIVGLNDDGAAVKATGSILLAGTATKAGTLSLYIAGKKAQVAVASGDDAATIASALQSVIAADSDYLVDAAVNGGTPEQLDFTAKNGGTPGNKIDLRMNYNDDDETPAGITATIADMSGGLTNPDVSQVFDILDETQYILMVSAYLDSSNLSAVESELADRFGPLKQNDGYCFYAEKDTLSNLNTLGDSRNSQFTVIHRASGPTHPASQASAKAGVAAFYGSIDPARPFQTLPVRSILPESSDEKLTFQERNILLFHGISVDKVADGGVVVIERIITTYKKNNAGADDTSYLDLNTLLTLSYIRYDWRNYMLRKYPRHKLANDGTRYASGQAIMTPKLGKSEAINKFTEWEFNGLVEGLEQFKEDLIVERNSGDVNRLDFLMPPNLVNQLRVMGTKIAFLL